MDKEKALDIIQLNKQIFDKVKKEYSIDLVESNGMLDIHYIRNIIKLNPKVHLFDFPIKNDKVGAVACTIGEKHYIMLNSNLPKGEKNFHLAHDYYHIVHEHSEHISQLVCEFRERGMIFNEDTSEPYRNLIEKKASLYASFVLLPENNLRERFNFSKQVYSGNLLPCVCEIMNEKMVPYSLTIIRLRELEIINSEQFDELIGIDDEEIVKCFLFYGIDSSCIEISNESNYLKFENSIIDISNKNEGEIVDHAIEILINIIEKEFNVNGDNDDE